MMKINTSEIVSLPLERAPVRRRTVARRCFADVYYPPHARRKAPGIIDELVTAVTTMLC